MPTTSITLAGNTVTVVTLPTSPGFRTCKVTASNKVAIVTSPFSGNTQAQRWPGAELWKGTFSLPPMDRAQADTWTAALMQLQGMTNAFMLGDPLHSSPRGTPTGVPTVDTGFTMKPGSSTLYTYGFTANSANVFRAGDAIQVGYRLYRAMDDVSADANGKAAIPIWPSIRETPTGLLVYRSPQGIFRLASNDQTWSFDYSGLTDISFDFMEYR